MFITKICNIQISETLAFLFLGDFFSKSPRNDQRNIDAITMETNITYSSAALFPQLFQWQVTCLVVRLETQGMMIYAFIKVVNKSQMKFFSNSPKTQGQPHKRIPGRSVDSNTFNGRSFLHSSKHCTSGNRKIWQVSCQMVLCRLCEVEF